MSSTSDVLANSDLAQYSAHKLFVPVYDTFTNYHSKNISTGGADHKPIREDLGMRAWRYIGGGKTITSETMVPIGVLIMLYNSVHDSRPKPQPIREHPISRTIEKLTGQKIEAPSDLVPMACTLGSDILTALVEKH